MRIRSQFFMVSALLCVASSQSLAQTKTKETDSKTPGKKSLLVQQADSTTSPKIAVGTKAISQVAANSSEDLDVTLRKVDRKTLTATQSTSGGETYLFKYNFTPGLEIQSEIVHLAKTDTKVDSTDQLSNSRTVSKKTWKVTKAENGEMTFEYRINEIDMSQQLGTEPEIRYSSKGKEEPAKPFEAAAASVGKLISTVTIDEQGMIIARSDETNPPNLGMGDITLPVPAEPMSIGSTWEIPRELRIRREDGSLKTVRFRELFRLDKVSAGIASVAVRSEMLTAITDPKEEAQVLQQLSNGTIQFDLDAGRMISKELAWDKTVVGFSGTGSIMDYSARLDEKVIKADTAIASKTDSSGTNR